MLVLRAQLFAKTCASYQRTVGLPTFLAVVFLLLHMCRFSPVFVSVLLASLLTLV